MSELDRVKNVVLSVLEEDEKSRSNDNRLICLVCEKIALRNGFDIGHCSFSDVINNPSVYGIPSFESITRCRRKLQEKHFHLRATDEVERFRAENEEKYRKEFAK